MTLEDIFEKGDPLCCRCPGHVRAARTGRDGISNLECSVFISSITTLFQSILLDVVEAHDVVFAGTVLTMFNSMGIQCLAYLWNSRQEL